MIGTNGLVANMTASAMSLRERIARAPFDHDHRVAAAARPQTFMSLSASWVLVG